jgi:peptidoglycan hydrolase CwlO-like protein
MAGSSDRFDRRLNQYMNLMVDLRVSQVVTDKQISQLGTKVDRIADAVESLQETVSVMVPIVLKQQEQMEKHQAEMEKNRESMDEYNRRIAEHTKNIEDLYRSQGYFLRRLFGEDLGTSE